MTLKNKLSRSDRAKYREAQRLSERGDVPGYAPLLLELVESNPNVHRLVHLASSCRTVGPIRMGDETDREPAIKAQKPKASRAKGRVGGGGGWG